jgi:hypothetical protein
MGFGGDTFAECIIADSLVVVSPLRHSFVDVGISTAASCVLRVTGVLVPCLLLE